MRFPDATFEENVHTSESFIRSFCVSVVTPLGLQPSNCEVLEVRAGSVVVDYVLLGVKPTSQTETFLETDKAFANAVARNLASSRDGFVIDLGVGIPQECASVKQEEFNPTPIILTASSAILVASLAIFVARSYRGKVKVAKVISEQVSRTKSELKDIDTERARKEEQMRKMTAKSMMLTEEEHIAVMKVFDGMERHVREVYFQDLEIEMLLGSGAFGAVHRCTWAAEAVNSKGDPETVAAKIMNRQHLKPNTLLNVRGEILLLAALKPHPNIIRFIGASWNAPPHISIVLEYADGGDLHTLLHDQVEKELLWTDPLLHIATGIVRGLVHLHAHTYVHRDIKSQNILLTKKDLILKLGIWERRVLSTMPII